MEHQGAPVTSGPDEHSSRGAARLRRSRVPLAIIDQLEDVVHYLIAAVLIRVAGYVLVRTAVDLFSTGTSFAERVTTAINDVLFVIILLEHYLENFKSH